MTQKDSLPLDLQAHSATEAQPATGPQAAAEAPPAVVTGRQQPVVAQVATEAQATAEAALPVIPAVQFVDTDGDRNTLQLDELSLSWYTNSFCVLSDIRELAYCKDTHEIEAPRGSADKPTAIFKASGVELEHLLIQIAHLASVANVNLMGFPDRIAIVSATARDLFNAILPYSAATETTIDFESLDYTLSRYLSKVTPCTSCAKAVLTMLQDRVVAFYKSFNQPLDLKSWCTGYNSMLTPVEKVELQRFERSEKSKGLGASAQYLLQDFLSDVREKMLHMSTLSSQGAAEKDDPFHLPRFYEASPVMCIGERARGFGKICPRNDELHCSYVDALDQGSCDKAGKMTHFVSWTWSYRVDFFVSCIEAWIQSHSPNELQSENVYLWM